METKEIEQGIPAFILFEKTSLCKTRSEARRLISQGGGYVNDRRLDQFDKIIDSKDVTNKSILLRAGKKRYLRVVID
jgi:tyrosyl-tRNA synthetase